MTEYSIREVIEMAVQTEKKGYDFYTEMTEKFKEEKEIHDLFSTLAKKEQVHQRRFEDLKNMLGDQEPEEWDQVAEYMRAIIESAFFLGRDKATMHMQNIQDYRAAVGFALGFEKETLLFYYGIRDAVKEKEIVDEIIQEEHSHIKWLNQIRSK